MFMYICICTFCHAFPCGNIIIIVIIVVINIQQITADIYQRLLSSHFNNCEYVIIAVITFFSLL